MTRCETHPEEGMTYACPGCDTGGTSYQRADGSWRCYRCEADFDEPVERENRSTNPEGRPIGPHSAIGQRLMDADPDDLGAGPA